MNDINKRTMKNPGSPLHLTPPGVTLWYGYGYCMGSDSAIGYMKHFLLDRQKRYGTYMNRFDGWIEAQCYSREHNHRPGQPFVVQYRNGLRLLRELKEADPVMGIEGCNSGGEWANWDKTEFIESQQTSDGGGEDDFYHLSYFWCVSKMMVMDASSGIISKTSEASCSAFTFLKGTPNILLFSSKRKSSETIFFSIISSSCVLPVVSTCFFKSFNVCSEK